MNLYPYTNFHDLNLDWLLQQLREAVFSVNGQKPDEEGNVNLPGVSGVTSVNGIGADGAGNIQISAANVGAVPAASLTVTDYAGQLDSDNTTGVGYWFLRSNDILATSIFSTLLKTGNSYPVTWIPQTMYISDIAAVIGNPFNLPAQNLFTQPAISQLLGTANLFSTVDPNLLYLTVDVWTWYDGTSTHLSIGSPDPDVLNNLDYRIMSINSTHIN